MIDTQKRPMNETREKEDSPESPGPPVRKNAPKNKRLLVNIIFHKPSPVL